MKLQLWATDLIDPDPNQPRENIDPEFVQRLAADISNRGLLQPLIAKLAAGRLALIDGHCRLSALKLAAIPKAAVMVFDSEPSATDILQVQLAANCLRTDLKPVEKARAFHRLKEAKGWSSSDLARELHLSKSLVTECLSHLSHPPEVQEMIDSGRLAGSTAYAISRERDQSVREKLVADAVEGKLSRAEATERVKSRGKVANTFRVALAIDGVEFVVNATKALNLEQMESLSRKLGQECRASARQGFDIRTLERMLADKARAGGSQASVSSANEKCSSKEIVANGK